MQVTNDLSAPLTGEEFERLDRFLLDRIGESDESDAERDTGILDVSELDGFLAAIVSGPETVMPSVWLPAVWGDCEPEWQSEDELMAIFALIMRHMNSISAHLMEEPETFKPLFAVRTVDDKEYLVVDEWCSGYVRGMALTVEAWREGGDRLEVLLQPIFTFGTSAGWDALEEMEEGEEESLRQAIAPAVRGVHAYWLERRKPGAGTATGEPYRRGSARVGRNDPCPCGSGKKYKHCCLH